LDRAPPKLLYYNQKRHSGCNQGARFFLRFYNKRRFGNTSHQSVSHWKGIISRFQSGSNSDKIHPPDFIIFSANFKLVGGKKTFSEIPEPGKATAKRASLLSAGFMRQKNLSTANPETMAIG